MFRGVDLLVLGIIAYSAIGALNPKSPTFSSANQRDVKKRPSGKPRLQQGILCSLQAMPRKHVFRERCKQINTDA